MTPHTPLHSFCIGRSSDLNKITQVLTTANSDNCVLTVGVHLPCWKSLLWIVLRPLVRNLSRIPRVGAS